MNGTGESEQGLRQILDLTRICSLVVLGLHFYFYCYALFKRWQLTSSISDRLLENVARTGLFQHFFFSKVISIGLLVISLLGARGRKDESVRLPPIAFTTVAGLFIYFFSGEIFQLFLGAEAKALLYIGFT
ncbi:MAG: YWFCY domain-containing protein, partial [Flavisolibacter sp.]